MMKHFVAVLAAGCLLAVASGCTAEEKKAAGQKVELQDLNDKVSYAIGLNIGRDFKEQEIEVDPDILAQGIRDVIGGVEPQMTEEQVQETIMAFQKEMVAKQEKKTKEQAEKNIKAGETFLAEKAKEEGVVTLPSGLMYKVVEEGTGPQPEPGDTVKVNYEGRLVDGTVFDSSYQRGEPATFPVMGVIPGWTEALQLMKQGAKWELYIPPKLAYGERGAGPVIGPNSTLIFTVELLEVVQDTGGQAKPQAKPGQPKK